MVDLRGRNTAVLQLPAREPVTVDDAQRHDSIVVSPVISGLVAQMDWHG
jgi:hypothetical protein